MKNRIIHIQLLVLLVFMISCKGTEKTASLVSQPHYTIDSIWDQDVKDKSFGRLIDKYKSQLDGEMNAIISVSEMDMVTGKPEGKLSNFIADAMFEIGKTYCMHNELPHSVDFSVMNMGGIRTAMSKGEISTGNMYEMLPFKNKLVIVGMKGENVQELLNEIAAANGEGVSGLKMGLKNKKAVEVLIGGEPLKKDKVYHVISIDYLVNGGGGSKAFQKRETFRHMHRKLRSEIIAYMKAKYEKGEELTSELDGRIYHVE